MVADLALANELLKKGRTRLWEKPPFKSCWWWWKRSRVLKASVLSGYSRSSYYYRPKHPGAVFISNRTRRSDSTEASALEAMEKVALEYPSYGVRRITAMLHRSGIIANRKRVYRLMKHANLARKRSVRKHVIIKRILTVPERPDWLWQQDITYIWCGRDGWCYLFSILDCYTRECLAYTFSTQSSTDESIMTLETAVLERFPDGVIPPHSDLATRSDGGVGRSTRLLGLWIHWRYME